MFSTYPWRCYLNLRLGSEISKSSVNHGLKKSGENSCLLPRCQPPLNMLKTARDSQAEGCWQVGGLLTCSGREPSPSRPPVDSGSRQTCAGQCPCRQQLTSQSPLRSAPACGWSCTRGGWTPSSAGLYTASQSGLALALRLVCGRMVHSLTDSTINFQVMHCH